MSEGAIYIHASDGAPEDIQEFACRKLATEMGCAVSSQNIWRDGKSIPVGFRTGLIEMVTGIAGEEISDLFIYSPECLDMEWVGRTGFFLFCKAASVRLHYVTEHSARAEDNHASADLLPYILGFLECDRRRQMSGRIRLGQRLAAQQGRWPGGVAGLYGYDYDDEWKRRKVNPSECKVVQQMFTDKAGGQKISTIARNLNANGIRTKAGSAWSGLEVYRLLRNERYTGIDYWGKTKTECLSYAKRSTVVRPKEEWIEIRGITPRIISDELFAKVQQVLADESQKGG